MEKLAPTVRSVDKDEVQHLVSAYSSIHDDTKSSHKEDRISKYAQMVNQYYDLATDFYEWGWGQSFHFAIQHYNESFQASIARHEHYLALRLGLQKDWEVLDVGCGVGGPARNIARFAECHVTGLNNNEYQVGRANKITAKQGLSPRASFVKGDFMHQPFEDNKFDAAYQIEATAHAPDKAGCYREILRVLKPGGVFAGYEWCLTDQYDPEDPEHREIKKNIEIGNGLPDIATTEEVLEALRAAGYEAVTGRDCAKDARPGFEHPWYLYLTPSYFSPTRFQFTPIGQWLAAKALELLEKIHLVPKGTSGVQGILLKGAIGLSAGGTSGVFTPMFFHYGRKPLTTEDN